VCGATQREEREGRGALAMVGQAPVSGGGGNASQNLVAHLKTTAASRCNRKSTRGRSHGLERLDGGRATTANGTGGRSLLRLFEMGERVIGVVEGTMAGLKARRGEAAAGAMVCHPAGGAAHR
jgi:hypothetical protein